MKIWRIEFGLWKRDSKLTLKDWFELEFIHACCGCYLLTVSRFYVTYLNGECYLGYFPDDPNPESPRDESDNS